jgi:hypothetical protein
MTSEQIRERVEFYFEAFKKGQITEQEFDAFIEAIARIANRS